MENQEKSVKATSAKRPDKGGQQDATEISQKPLKYPIATIFILTNKFCERFGYYGMRAILVIYLSSKLQFNKDESTIVFHIFNMMAYTFPIVGAIVGDSWWGKYNTILYFSVVYVFGSVTLALVAVPTLDLPARPATLLALVFIAMGTGGMKPCIAAFGGDQYKLPEQSKQLATYFSLFYFAVNAGSMLATIITPILRAFQCFGNKDCFPLPFTLSAIMIVFSVIVLVVGRKLYIMKHPAGNIIFALSKCISFGIGGWRKEHKTRPLNHWLDYAEPKVGQQMVSDTKVLLKILLLYLPFPVFWSLFDQQASRWTLQATRMDGELWGFTLKPDHMQLFNPILIIIFIPIFNIIVYPLISLIGVRRPLQKLSIGGLMAAVAFFMSAILELKLDATDPILPTSVTSQLRMYNGMPCDYNFKTEPFLNDLKQDKRFTALGLWEEKKIVAPSTLAYKFDASAINGNCPSISGNINLIPGKSVSYFIANDRMYEFEDEIKKPILGNPIVRVLLNVPPSEDTFNLKDSTNIMATLSSYNTSQAITVSIGKVMLCLKNDLVLTNFAARSGGIYALLVNGNKMKGYNFQTHVVTEPNSIHMLWQLPQYLAITFAEIMFNITGITFTFTQAPLSMKSVLQACWSLTTAMGNMLVVVIAKVKFVESQAGEFALFASLMVIDMLIFMLLAMFYKYVEHADEPVTLPQQPTTSSTP